MNHHRHLPNYKAISHTQKYTAYGIYDKKIVFDKKIVHGKKIIHSKKKPNDNNDKNF